VAWEKESGESIGQTKNEGELIKGQKPGLKIPVKGEGK
jgi:hypothetical protein